MIRLKPLINDTQVKKFLREAFGQPTQQQLIPDDEEELWKIIQSLPNNYSIQFSIFHPSPQGLILIYHAQGDVWAATILSRDFGNTDGKWHKATEILLRSLTTQLYDYGEHHDVYYSMVETTSDKKMEEAMYSREFDRSIRGSCVTAAELATRYLLSKRRKDFKVVECWVSFDDNYEIEKYFGQYYVAGAYEHTIIEFNNGRFFDPTKEQWRKIGEDPKDARIVEIKKKYDPEEYIKLCDKNPNHPWDRYKKVQTESKIKSEKDKQTIIRNLIPRLKDDNVIITVNQIKEVPAANYVQVDFMIKGHNLLSTNPENLIKHGFRIPDTKTLLRLPTGKYRISDLRDKLTENMTYDDLLKLTAKIPRSPEDGTNRIDRSKTVNSRSIPVTVEEDGERWNFRYKSTPHATVTDEPFEGHITFLKGEVGKNDNAMKLECKVDCGCPDYMYRFAYNNFAQGAGNIGPDSENNAINRRPKPAYDLGEGLCKHLTSLAKYLKTKIAGTKRQNIFEAIGEVAKQGPFNITYYD